MLITRGLSEWNRLEHYLAAGLTLKLTNEEEREPLRASSEQLAMLLDTVRALVEGFAALPQEDTWSAFSQRWQAIVDRFIDLEGEQEPVGVKEAIDGIFTELAALDAVAPKTSLTHFTRTLQKRLERASIAITREPTSGVAVLDAMSARGIRFRAVVLLGMNEGVFPRTIREDPFLRDRYRRVLELVLGFKVPEKLAGYDEEKLLFSLITGSASDCLYLVHQRSDTAGRALSPSWYLEEFRSAACAGGQPPATLAIPRSIMARQAVPPFDNVRWLTPDELAVQRAIASQDPSPLLALVATTQESYAQGLALVRLLEADGNVPGPFDGETGPAGRGLEPTRKPRRIAHATGVLRALPVPVFCAPRAAARTTRPPRGADDTRARRAGQDLPRRSAPLLRGSGARSPQHGRGRCPGSHQPGGGRNNRQV